MDVDALRKELEEHLEKNPDQDAPSGFRDRFESALEQMDADDGISDEQREAELQRIRDEAKAAHSCVSDQSDVPDNESGTKPEGGGDGSADAERPNPTAILRRFSIPFGVAVIALAAAYFAFRS